MVNVKKLNFWISEELILVLNALLKFMQEGNTNGKSSKLIKLSMLSWNCLASTMFSLLRPTMSVLVQMNLMKSNMSPTSNQLQSLHQVFFSFLCLIVQIIRNAGARGARGATDNPNFRKITFYKGLFTVVLSCGSERKKVHGI